jgi:hypothetical protein
MVYDGPKSGTFWKTAKWMDTLWTMAPKKGKQWWCFHWVLIQNVPTTQTHVYPLYPLSAGGTCRGNLTKWQTKSPYADLSEDSVLQNAILKKSTNSTPKLQFYTIKRSAERFFLNIPYIGCCLDTFWCTSFCITIFYLYPVFWICHKQLTRETTNPTLPPRHHHNMETAGHDYILVSHYCRGNLQGEPNKVTNQVPVCWFIWG